MANREITAAQARNGALRVDRLVGRIVGQVLTHGKHLFVEFPPAVHDDGQTLVLRTHMMMSGSWHLYTAGATWKRPQRQAVLVLEAGERVAVCFNAPVVELMVQRVSTLKREQTGLGPDILQKPLDIAKILDRVTRVDQTLAVGAVLLDQHVVAGIGNIYRCESLFLQGIDPWTPVGDLPLDVLEQLVLCAATLMHANLTSTNDVARTFGNGPSRPWVYGRAGRPCRRCAGLISSQKLGMQARTVYWCRACQHPIALE